MSYDENSTRELAANDNVAEHRDALTRDHSINCVQFFLAYGGNYSRLLALKTKYDPTNFFRLNQNIKPAAETMRGRAE